MRKGTDEGGYRALRSSVAFRILPDLRCLQLTGRAVFDALDAVCPCDLFLRSGELRPTVLLRDDGIVFADTCVAREGDTGYLLCYGPEADELAAWIRGRVPEGADLRIIDLGESHEAVSLDGPFAWELCGEVFGSDVVGLPPMGVMDLDGAVVFRIERTGEYGYCALVPREEWNSSLEDEIRTRGMEFNLGHTDEAAWSQCLLENLSFDMNREGRLGLTPMELQLQWRLSSRKQGYPGAEAVRSIRRSGWDRRVTLFSAPSDVAEGAEIACEGKPVGNVLVSGYSPARGDYVGKALIRRPYWHAGLDNFRIGTEALTTISAPAIHSLSMAVSPYRDSFHARRDDVP